ncbi:MAG: hypothetical protein RIB46_08810 [Pseudomonadales bacterium]
MTPATRRPARALAAIAIALVCANVSADMGPLEGLIEPHQGQAWTVSRAQQGGWLFENPDAAYDIQYYYLNPKPGEAGRREISVDVSHLSGSGDSLAGILYGFVDSPRSYYMFTVGGDRSVNLHYVEEGNVEEKMKLQLGDMRSARARLTLRESGTEIALLVNGQEKSTLANDRMGQGAVGIVTAHTGLFHLDNFDVKSP